MSTRDNIWVCWQEPAVDCGKTSHIPYSWVTEVLIGDGRAPGSVLKCRWPKSRRLYVAKVIAPPIIRQCRQHSEENHVLSRSEFGGGGGDDEACPAIEQLAMSDVSQISPSDQSGSEDGNKTTSSGRNSVGTPDEGRRKKKTESQRGSKESSDCQSNEGHDLDDGQQEDPIVETEEHHPPVLVPEVSSSSCFNLQHASSPVVYPRVNTGNHRKRRSASPSSTAFPKELQRWFIVQLNGLKNEMSNNFDQINHKLTAMDLSIRHVRDRMNRLEGKMDLALLNSGSSGDGPTGQSEWRWEEGDSTQPGTPNKKKQADDQPPPLKRQRPSGSNETSNENGQNKTEPPRQVWGIKSIMDAHMNASPSSPHRNARKSIVHRASAPISPPPRLTRENADSSRQTTENHSPQPPTLSVNASNNNRVSTPSMKINQNQQQQRKRKSSLVPKLVVTYKPGSDNRLIYLGGDPTYEIQTETYVESLENMFNQEPVYLVLSLIRRILSDRDMSRLWFRPDAPTQPGFYALTNSFEEAIKKQAVQQFPNKSIPERDFWTKLHQATHDAKYRMRHGKGSQSRPQSYFELETVSKPLTPNETGNSAIQKENSLKSEMDKDESGGDLLCGPLIRLGDADEDSQVSEDGESKNNLMLQT